MEEGEGYGKRKWKTEAGGIKRYVLEIYYKGCHRSGGPRGGSVEQGAGEKIEGERSLGARITQGVDGR